jgi:hypothetical protein
MSNGAGKKIALGCGVVVGGMILLAIVAMVASQFFTTPEMRAQSKKSASDGSDSGQVSAKAKVDTFFKSLSDLRRSLPDGSTLKEKRATPACVPSTTDFSGAPYMAVDYGWFNQFSDRGFVPAKPARNPPPWYRDQDFRNIEGAAVPSEGMPEPDYDALLLNEDDMESLPYIAVFLPLEESWPVLSTDGVSFRGGLFRGWVILVDSKKRKPIGQSKFMAGSSPKITSFQIGVHNQMLVGDDLKAAMEKDFTDHFWRAADASIARICGHEGKADFASHETSGHPH